MARSLPMGAARVATRLAFVGFSLCVLGLSASAAGSGADSKRLRLHAPTHLRITSAKQTSLRLSWKASRDKARVAGYYVYRGGRRVASVKRTVTSYTFRGLRCGTGFVLGVSARGAGGSVSTRPSVRGRTAACPVPRDTQAPTAPSELTVTASSRSTLTVAWKAATDNVGVTGYQVYVGGARIATVAATAYTLTGLSCGVSYDVALEAVDSAGNASSRATLQDTTVGCPPPAPSGGTLRVDLNTDVDFTDPSLAYSSTAFQLEYATGLKLYNYPDRPAPEGSMLVHEAAVGFPLITDGGKTYTITLKPDLKFSDGTPVTAANFAYAINRALQPRMASPAVAFIREIVGALDVADDKAAAASGVQAQGDKLIIKLVQPAGTF